ncbi:MAG: hypothetical protein LBQ88_14775 [Treponema sp.]|nr:hypothetical protein [Treponema sp.]
MITAKDAEWTRAVILAMNVYAGTVNTVYQTPIEPPVRGAALIGIFA